MSRCSTIPRTPRTAAPCALPGARLRSPVWPDSTAPWRGVTPEARLLMQCGNRWLLTAPREAGVRRLVAPGASRVRRPGLGECLDVHPRDLPALCARLKRAGQAHALAAQTGHYQTGFKRRELVRLWRPATSTASSFLATSAGVTP